MKCHNFLIIIMLFVFVSCSTATDTNSQDETQYKLEVCKEALSTSINLIDLQIITLEACWVMRITEVKTEIPSIAAINAAGAIT